MIQILTYDGKSTNFQGDNVVINSIHDARSLDEFSVDIISLQNQGVWYNRDNDTTSINCLDDFVSLSESIRNSDKAKIIILLPQNYTFHYCYMPTNGTYYKTEELKNILPELKRILYSLYIPIAGLDIMYENTDTKIGNNMIPSNFIFNNIEENILTKSDKSQKPTTIEIHNVILSTLNITTYDDMIKFLKNIGLLSEKQERPKWMEGVNMFDDDKQIEIIRDNQNKIQIAETNIEEARKVIDKNNKYKSILYTNGEELVKVVLEILEEMLGCDFSNFKDVKREDFLTIVDEYTFIGEIKGVNHNVKSENIAQLERHYQSFLDDNPDADESKICALLIMDYQKNKPIQEREPVHEKQVALARKYGSLIIDTYTLLKLFEKYISGEKSRAECIDILQNNTGLLRI